MKYNEGDRLLFRAYSGSFSTYISDQPTNSKNIQFDFYACTDASGNHYPVVVLGKKVWMAENLRTSHFQNNQSIPRYDANDHWKNASGSAYCIYDNLPASNSDHGFLYNWHITDNEQFRNTGSVLCNKK